MVIASFEEKNVFQQLLCGNAFYIFCILIYLGDPSTLQVQAHHGPNSGLVNPTAVKAPHKNIFNRIHPEEPL